MWRHGRAAPVIGTLLLTMMLVASCSTHAGGAAPTSSTPVAPTTGDVHSLASADCPDLACGGPLTPGEYVADYFDQTIGFEIAAPGWDWSYNGGTLSLIADDFHNGLLYSSDGIYFLRDPAIASQDCEEAPEPGVGRSADELAAWLEDAPGLPGERVGPRVVGGLDGVRAGPLDRPSLGADMSLQPAPADPASVPFRGAAVGGYHWAMVPEQSMRWYILDTEDGVIIVDIEDAPAGAPHDELLADGRSDRGVVGVLGLTREDRPGASSLSAHDERVKGVLSYVTVCA